MPVIPATPGRRLFLSGLAALPFLTRPALAATPPVYAFEGIAIHGIDPVAYFTMGKPVDGLPELSAAWNGANFRFATQEHKAMFEAEPETYAPRYGGYCAFAMSKGAIATSVPEAWTVYENRLYLNFSTAVRSLWRKDIPGNIAQADTFWPDILDA